MQVLMTGALLIPKLRWFKLVFLCILCFHSNAFPPFLCWTSSIFWGYKQNDAVLGPVPVHTHSQVADIYHHNRIWTFTCLEVTTNLGESEKSQERRNTEAKIWRLRNSLNIFNFIEKSSLTMIVVNILQRATLAWISDLLFTPLWIYLIFLHSHVTSGNVLCGILASMSILGI